MKYDTLCVHYTYIHEHKHFLYSLYDIYIGLYKKGGVKTFRGKPYSQIR